MRCSIVLLSLIGMSSIAPLAAQSGGPQTVTFSYAGNPLPILPDDADVITLAYVNAGRALEISKVTARVKISYPRVDDLKIYLYSPEGTRTKLLENNCGSLVNVDTTFSDDAETKYSDFCPAEAGRGPFRGNEPLHNSEGESSFGTWVLAVENDQSDSRRGWIEEVSLTITGTEQFVPAILSSDGIRNTSSLFARPIAPGSRITILGTSLGPSPGITEESEFWPTWMDGTVVRVNGQDASMRYLGFFRIEAQVPIELDLSKPAEIYVYRQGVNTNTVTVDVSPASPGVPTINELGFGQAVAWNSDGSQNLLTNGAARGSTLRLLATGLGTTNPLVAAGQIPGPNPGPPVVAPVAVIVGGVAVPATSARAAEGRVGDYFVEFTVPPQLAIGPWEVFVTCGNYTSQSGVLITVK